MVAHAPSSSVDPGFSPSLLKRALLSLVSGAIAPLAFSPNNMWVLGMVSVMGLYVALKHATPRQGAITGWCYGLGFFGVGVSWVFVSINVYGNASEFFAGLITAVFVAGLSLFIALQGWLNQRFFNRSFYLFSFAALWVLGEWFRGWFLTGFPWLYMGYPHVNSAFSGLAPLLGVLGISGVVVLSGAGFGEMYLAWHRTHSLYTVARTYIPTGLFLVWTIAALAGQFTWVTTTGEAVSIGIVQGNIAQGEKFDANLRRRNLDIYENLTNPLWNSDIVFWPETAIPYLYDENGDIERYFSSAATSHDSTLVSGIFGSNGDDTYNSIASLGASQDIYHKQKLVPFGEYAPPLFSVFFQLFDLPMSSLSPGPSGQDLLAAGNYTLAPFICYEVVYPDFVRRQAHDADFLVTISNDTWFGASWGPLQHLEMAAMRALENGRYMVRATNNGVSAIINEKGEIVTQSAQFQAQTLAGSVLLMDGRTPFSRWGSWPVILCCLGVLFFIYQGAGPAMRLLTLLRNRQ